MKAAAGDFLLIQGRNLGDAVIGTGLVEAIGRSFPLSKISVLTRPQFRILYAGNPHVAEIFTADFPMGTVKHFGVRSAIRLAAQIWRLHRRRFGFVVHMGGDFRENVLGWLISPAGNVSSAWALGHPFQRLIRRGFTSLQTKKVDVGPDVVSVYAAQELLAQALGAESPAQPRLYGGDGNAVRHNPAGQTIGLHVAASVDCKKWPVASWRALIAGILSRRMAVRLFGAPDELAAMTADYGDLLGPSVSISTGPLQSFFVALSEVRAIVCLDSFSVHAAHAIGVPSIMLNGPNLASLVQPPSTEVINGNGGLACAPCFNLPTCGGEYTCMHRITPGEVLAKIDQLCSAGSVDLPIATAR